MKNGIRLPLRIDVTAAYYPKSETIIETHRLPVLLVHIDPVGVELIDGIFQESPPDAPASEVVMDEQQLHLRPIHPRKPHDPAIFLAGI